MRIRYPNNVRLKLNIVKNLYEISQDGITYAMPMELTGPIKEYFVYYNPLSNLEERTVAEWYKRLSSSDKKKVKRSGNVPQGDIFYPDVEYD